MPHQHLADTIDQAIGNDEDIVRSFEDGTFLRKYGNRNSPSTLLSQMDQFILMLNTDFVPNLFSELSNFTNQELNNCLDKIVMIQRISTLLYQRTEKCKSKDDYGFKYSCSKCNTVIEANPHQSVSIALQQHDHIEAALAHPHFVEEANISIPLEQSELLNYCDNCKCALSIPTNFKFDFNISYHPDVEMFLYMHNFTNDVVFFDNLNLFTLQLKSPLVCMCLLCVKDFALCLAKEHVKGRKHEKNKECVASVQTFLAYHKNWLMQEDCYQAHQMYFIPFSIDTTVCCLCNTMHVPYILLQFHINSKVHKMNVCQVFNSNVLIQLQKQVYVKKQTQMELSNDKIKVDHVAKLEQPSTSNLTVQEQSESDNSDDQNSLLESDDTLLSTPEEEKNKAIETHDIIKSIVADSATEVQRFIEHRFWPHFAEIMQISEKAIMCQFCNVSVDKDRKSVIQHITSNTHKRCRIDLKRRYNFYCEICNIWVRSEQFWMVHMSNDKHLTRCQKLGESRKNKLTEYECKSCKQIIFGDEISIQRHKMMTNKKRKRKPNKVVLDKRMIDIFNNEKNILYEVEGLVKDAEKVLINQTNVIQCCNTIKEVLMETYPNCNVHPFGSLVSGLGSKKSDLDLFVDLGDMYLGDKGQDSTSQVKIVLTVMKIFSKKKTEFKFLNPIPRARTPIIQLFHVKTGLDCDLSFRHGLSVENTKFLRLCIEIQPSTQAMILLLKQWLDYGKLAYRHITTYSLSMMVIFYLQVNNYLLPISEIRQLPSTSEIIIDGWSIMNVSSIHKEEITNKINSCDKTIKEMLTGFFLYYKNFNYATDIICPLLGRPLKKTIFENAEGADLPLEMSIYVHKVAHNTTELFKAQSPMCIQDPFDLSHNLTKSCSNSVVERFKKLCDLSYKLLTSY